MTDRRNLVALAAGLGLTVSLLGGGIFAVFTDRATTGQNDFHSSPLARAADLKLADPSQIEPYDCGAFVDDLATGIISGTDLSPGQSVGAFFVCLRNEGSASVTVELSVIDLVDLDVACTGDEAAAGDTTCGGDQLGELSQALQVGVTRVDCATHSNLAETLTGLASNAQTAVPLPGNATLGSGETACLGFVAQYPVGSAIDQQLTQSDKATWRYAFDGTTG